MRRARGSRKFMSAAIAATAMACGGLVAIAPAAGAAAPESPAHVSSQDPALVSIDVLPAQANGEGADNGLAATPPMGFNDWNALGCPPVSEAFIKATALAMHNNGMEAAGYKYVNIDDCWQDGRTVSGTAAKALQGRVNGHLVADPVFFPSGMPALADYIHSLGLKFGLYSSNGTGTCQGVAGTFGYENADAQDYAKWGVDYFKLDTCNSGLPSDPNAFYTRYKKLEDAFVATGRPIVFSLCDFTRGGQTWLWGSQVGNLWRTTGDISASFSSMVSNFTSNQTRRTYAGPGGWNDPDMLEIGNAGHVPPTSGYPLLTAPAAVGDTNVQVDTAPTAAVANSPFRIGGGNALAGADYTNGGVGVESFIASNIGTAAGAPTSLFSALAPGDTNIKVPTTSGFAVGNKLLLDPNGTYESPTITAVGTPGTATSLADAAAAGDTNVKVASTANLDAGDTLAIDDPPNVDTRTISSVGTAAGPATTAVAPTSAGDTDVKVASINGFTVGDPMVIDSGSSVERATVTSVGTAASAPTTLVAPATVGDSTVYVASTNGMTAGHQLALDTGAGTETATIQGVGTQAGAATTTVAPTQVGDTNVKVSSINGFVVGHKLALVEPGYLPAGAQTELATIQGIGTAAGAQTQSVAPANVGDTQIYVASTNGMTVGHQLQIMNYDGSNFETATIQAIGTAAGASTTLADAAKAGDTNLKVTSTTGFVPGQQLVVGVGSSQEVATVAAVGTAGATGTGISLAAPLTKDHLTLMLIRGMGTGVTVTPLAAAHPAGSATRDQGTGITVSALTAPHPLATTGGSPGGGISIRDVGTGVTVTPIASFHQNGASARDTGTGIGVTPLAMPHASGVASRDTGTGVTLSEPFSNTHVSAANVRDESKPGTGITFSPALSSAHPINTVVRGGGTGITLATPVTVPHPAGTPTGASSMTVPEEQSHLSLWAMMASPMIVGADIPDMASQNLAILLNKDVIAVDQDPLGVQAFTVTSANSQWTLMKPLADGDTAVAVFNAATTPWTNATVDFASVGLDPGQKYLAKDLWSKQVSAVTDPISVANVPAHSTDVYRVSSRAPAVSVPRPIVVNATGPNGATVDYTSSATDAFDESLPTACSTASGSTFPIGDTTVTCTATDAADHASSASFTVHVKGAAEQINDQTALVGTAGGGSFADQLQAVLNDLAANTPACGDLGAYINHVKAQSGKQLSTSLAATLTVNANRIQAVLSC